MYSKDMYKKAYKTIIHNSSKFERTQIPMNRRMYKL